MWKGFSVLVQAQKTDIHKQFPSEKQYTHFFL